MSDLRVPTQERLFALDWDGPFDINDLRSELHKDYKGAKEKWCLYALTSHHPLYGDDVITYIGKAVKQTVEKRLSQHKWWEGEAYLACIYEFESWDSYHKMGYDDALKKRENSELVSTIEELLIFSLSPAYNSRNKSSANPATSFRLFNTGEVGPIPVEISGLYYIENGPTPEEIDTLSDE